VDQAGDDQDSPDEAEYEHVFSPLPRA